jgi:hypothetical protein
MMIRPTLLVFAVLSSLTWSHPSRAVLLTNGDFEAPALAAGTSSTGLLAIPGWTATPPAPPSNFDLVNAGAGAPAYSGSQYVDLVGFGLTGGITQTFATVAGVLYNLTFAYANNFDFAPNASAHVSVTGAGALFDADISHNTSGSLDLDWIVFSALFMADSASTTLSFANTAGGPDGGILLDAVAVVETPLPAALPLFASVLGAGALLGLRRRRQKSQASAKESF